MRLELGMPRQPGDSDHVRQRRYRVLRRLSRGQTASEAAAAEGISPRTVQAIRQQAREEHERATRHACG
jgi:DNA-binding CsgD family transcriptional regulator